MSNFTVEKNVQMPDHWSRQPKYPFKQMEVGDSFAFTDHAESVKSICQRQFASDGSRMRFIVRRNGDGWRCWRVE